MNINKNVKLFLNNVYSYDISSCHYNILKSINYDISKIEKDDKLKRNTQIGLLMRDNPNLTTVIRSTTESLINEYILRNKISNDDIIIKQYDGFMCLKPLKITTDQYLPIELQTIFSVFIISLDRTKFIATDGNKISIKGISHRYNEMDKIYKKILFINYANKESVFTSMQNIKDEILTSVNPLLYCIPSGENKYNIFLKQYGQFEISETLIKILDTTDIDRRRYFDYYIQPFFDSITVEFI
jgi:hypothetical protein